MRSHIFIGILQLVVALAMLRFGVIWMVLANVLIYTFVWTLIWQWYINRLIGIRLYDRDGSVCRPAIHHDIFLGQGGLPQHRVKGSPNRLPRIKTNGNDRDIATHIQTRTLLMLYSHIRKNLNYFLLRINSTTSLKMTDLLKYMIAT